MNSNRAQKFRYKKWVWKIGNFARPGRLEDDGVSELRLLMKSQLLNPGWGQERKKGRWAERQWRSFKKLRIPIGRKPFPLCFLCFKENGKYWVLWTPNLISGNNFVGKNNRFIVRQPRFQISILLLPSYVTMGNLYNFSGCWFPNL